MKDLAKQLEMDLSLAQKVREVAEARKMSITAYVRRAVLRQLLEDIRVKPAQAAEQEAMKVGMEA